MTDGWDGGPKIVVPKYLSRIPASVPPGSILVHNHLQPTRRLGWRGFGAWLDRLAAPGRDRSSRARAAGRQSLGSTTASRHIGNRAADARALNSAERTRLKARFG